MSCITQSVGCRGTEIPTFYVTIVTTTKYKVHVPIHTIVVYQL